MWLSHRETPSGRLKRYSTMCNHDKNKTQQRLSTQQTHIHVQNTHSPVSMTSENFALIYIHFLGTYAYCKCLSNSNPNLNLNLNVHWHSSKSSSTNVMINKELFFVLKRKESMQCPHNISNTSTHTHTHTTGEWKDCFIQVRSIMEGYPQSWKNSKLGHEGKTGVG